MFTRTASGVNPAGTVQRSVGVKPLPEIVTLDGKGAAVAAAAPIIGVVAVAVSLPLWKVRSQALLRVGVKATLREQFLAFTASALHTVGTRTRVP
jgi:hypothetical protein